MEIDELEAGRELDALIAKLLERRGEEYAYASNDNGLSGCAFSDRTNGPWYSIRAVEEWLAERQSKGTHQDYQIVRRVRFPCYSTDIAAAWEVVEKLMAYGYRYVMRGNFEGNGLHWCGFDHQEWADMNPLFQSPPCVSLPLAICRAALKATDSTRP